MSNQRTGNNLNYLTDLTFNKVNRLFVLSYTNENDRMSFPKYYTPKVDIKDYNKLVDDKSYFDIPIKNNEEAYEKIIGRWDGIMIIQQIGRQIFFKAL